MKIPVEDKSRAKKVPVNIEKNEDGGEKTDGWL